jgi:formiminoglutamase
LRLPLLISVPHAGLWIPPEVASYCVLDTEDIVRDGDEGARETYDIAEEVAAYVTTDVARAIVDMNRPEDDRSVDGVVKTHTCWKVPIYSEALPEWLITGLLERYYRPYHRQLNELAGPEVRLGLDCHTMAAIGPPIGPDAGVRRPAVCVGNAGGTCPQAWLESLGECLARALDHQVELNEPFAGGYITRSRPGGIPWVQLELSRDPFFSPEEKRGRLLRALRSWCTAR